MVMQKKLFRSFLVLVLILGLSVAWQPVDARDRIDINTATAEQLTELKGVGPAIAQRIVDYREESGSFASVEQLLEIRGIGPKTLEGMADLIVVSPSPE